MLYDRILVPLDDTGTAQRGLQEALALAARLGATLVLLHVIEPITVVPDVGTLDTWQALRDSQQQVARQVLDEARQLAVDHGVAVETRVDDDASRRVAETIVAHADSAHCGLIVMGTHGRRGMRRLLLGSDAELVLRLSPVPVLLARGRDDPAALLA